MKRRQRRAALRNGSPAAPTASASRLAAQADTRARLAAAVDGWLAMSRAGDLGPVELPVGTFTGRNESGRPVTVRLVAHVTPAR